MMNSKIKLTLAAATAALLLTGLGTAAQASSETLNPGYAAAGKIAMAVRGQGKPTQGGGGGTNNGISYRGGPVMNQGIKIYPIWYGPWSDASKALINGFMSNVGGSPYFNINTTYYDSKNVKIVNNVSLGAAYNDAAESLGASLTDANIATLVNRAVTASGVAADPNGFYLVLTTADVKETSGFVTKYCGWHTHTAIGAVDTKYSFVGDPSTQGLASCSAQSISPNGNPGVDAMISVIAHELEEAATDPALNAWYDSRGYENGDKCAWTFGTQTTLPSGAKYNMTLNGVNYLVQQNWVNAAGGYCAMKY